jgi:hypothetical protein
LAHFEKFNLIWCFRLKICRNRNEWTFKNKQTITKDPSRSVRAVVKIKLSFFQIFFLNI